ncbi:TIGR02147 family protein [Pseudobacteriovorax antillogorgiicola]|uniref:TIGR02147 family protein n=1 Tax=Pseudobacteriovorax antillogorgiicola TaxID=1513793 RepID=A0A1Y6CT45_9BACT|nr:TIGR02147 family protein [Pseudobacteriovorax antillogorgiicola]TCS44797.1 uncharacterized protein (TIGR02147 family) [Pseudobacteriovorax antillogorgiicola]SMF77386.1 TIGR02147 family protein [Pseudobacteriovorax antillogorgiicola]
MIKIFGYTDFRKFLKDYYDQRKSEGQGFSYRRFSKQCDFNSPNFLKLVMEGKRNLSIDSIEKIVTSLNLSPNEGNYFRVLVKLNQESKHQIKAIYFDELKRLTPYAQKRKLDAESVEYLSHWLYPVLREMARQKDFRDDPYWIARRLTGRTSVKNIGKALQFLKENGFIVKQNNHCFTAPDIIVLSSDEVRSLAIRQYHRTILCQAQEALDDISVSEREFGALILSLSDDKVGELKQKLKAFRKEVHEWALHHQDIEEHKEQVVQLNFQMFPQSKR